MVNGKQHSVWFVPTGMKGLPQNVLLNFRLEIPKSDLTIYLPSGISEIFCQMVSTPDVSVFHGCSKTERKINFSQFKKALELCAEKKYGSKNDVGKLIEKICAGKGPATSGATVSCLNVTYCVVLYV